MTISFIFNEGRRVQSGYDRIKTTLIEYIDADGIADAFNQAAEYKHEVAVKISKGESKLFTKKAWGSKSDRIQISIDAVVAKPKLDVNRLDIDVEKSYYDSKTDTYYIQTQFGLLKIPETLIEALSEFKKNRDGTPKELDIGIFGEDAIVLKREHIEKLYNDLIDAQAKIKAITNTLSGDYNINWWLAILQKLLKNNKIGG